MVLHALDGISYVSTSRLLQILLLGMSLCMCVHGLDLGYLL